MLTRNGFALLNRHAELIEQHLMNEAQCNWSNHVEMGGEMNIDNDAVFQAAIEAVCPVEYQGLEWYREALWNHPRVTDALEEMEIAATEAAQDYLAFSDNPMKYFGMSERDFA